MKRVAGAAIAAGVGISALTLGVDPANATPSKPAPTWHGLFADQPGPGWTAAAAATRIRLAWWASARRATA